LWIYVALGNTTFTFASAPTNGQNIVIAFTNTTAAIVSMTWPATFYDYNSGTMIASLNMPAVKESVISAAYDGTIWRIMSATVLNSFPLVTITDASVLDMSIPEQMIVASGAITINSFANTSATEVRTVNLLIVRNGTDRVITTPDSVVIQDGNNSFTLTRVVGELRIKTWGQSWTNAIWTPLF